MKSIAFVLFLLASVARAQFQTFQTAGELRVAVGQYMNGTEELVAKYGDISLWNVSLVDDMTGKLLLLRYSSLLRIQTTSPDKFPFYSSRSFSRIWNFQWQHQFVGCWKCHGYFKNVPVSAFEGTHGASYISHKV